ncbi:MAG TPA: cupin domain-containing protein [Rhodothermales bacterium]
MSTPSSDSTTPSEVGREPIAPIRRCRREGSGIRWDDVDLKHYKEEGTHFRAITRQVLFDERAELSNEVRYFEIAPGGHSTFERHEHVHVVIVLSGSGRVVVGDSVQPIAPFDLVHVPPMTWHQFRADADAPLGFLCLVPCNRDRPIRPTPEEAESLRSDPHIGSFIRL